MALGLFITGFTVAEVLVIQDKAKQLLLEGKTIMSWGDSGTNVTKELPMSVRETLEECGHALRALDPDTYGQPRRVAVSRADRIAL
jgi:hypothetical protein